MTKYVKDMTASFTTNHYSVSILSKQIEQLANIVRSVAST